MLRERPGRGEMGSKVVHLIVECIDLILQGCDVRSQLFILPRVGKVAIVRCVGAVEIQSAAALTWRITVAFYLPALTLLLKLVIVSTYRRG